MSTGGRHGRAGQHVSGPIGASGDGECDAGVPVGPRGRGNVLQLGRQVPPGTERRGARQAAPGRFGRHCGHVCQSLEGGEHEEGHENENEENNVPETPVGPRGRGADRRARRRVRRRPRGWKGHAWTSQGQNQTEKTMRESNRHENGQGKERSAPKQMDKRAQSTSPRSPFSAKSRAAASRHLPPPPPPKWVSAKAVLPGRS